MRVYACEVEPGDRLLASTIVEPHGAPLVRDERVRSVRPATDDTRVTITTDVGRYTVNRGRLLAVISR